jgi:hypothetical protein
VRQESRSSDPEYLIFVGLDRFGECFLAAFSTIGDPLEFRTRHEKLLDRATMPDMVILLKMSRGRPAAFSN